MMKTPPASLSRRDLWSIALISFIVLIVEAALIPTMNVSDPQYRSWDSQQYIAMAKGSSDTTKLTAPFCWRILVPAAVRLLPWSAEQSYYMLTCASLFAAAIGLLFFSLGEGLSKFESAAIVILFLFHRWITGYLLFDYALVDPEALACLIIILWLAERKTPLIVMIPLLILGMMCKEQIIIAGVYLSVKYWKDETHKQEKYFYLVLPTAACLLVYAALRLIIVPSGNYGIGQQLVHRFTSLDPVGYFNYTARQWLIFLYDAIVGSLGAVLILILASGKNFFRQLWERPEFLILLALVAMQLLVAWNLERLLVYAFPFVAVLSVKGLRTASWNRRISPGVILWIAVAIQILHFIQFLLAAHGYNVFSIKQIILLSPAPRLF